MFCKPNLSTFHQLSRVAFMIFKDRWGYTKPHYYKPVCTTRVWFRYAYLAILPRMNQN